MSDDEVVTVGDLILDLGRWELRTQGVMVRLTPSEFQLLKTMMSRPGRIYTRENLLAKVWGYTHQGYSRAVDAHINRIKAKLKARGASSARIEGVYGAGYRVSEAVLDPARLLGDGDDHDVRR